MLDRTPTVFSFVERTLQVIKRISEEFIEPSALAEPEVTDHEERLRGRKNRRRLLDFCCILLDTIDAKQNPNPELGATVIRPSFVDEVILVVCSMFSLYFSLFFFLVLVGSRTYCYFPFS